VSVAEYSGPTEPEVAVLTIAHAMRDVGYVLDGSVHEAEARALARRLAERGLGEMSIEGRAGEVFRINSAGSRFLRHRWGQAS